MMVLVLLLVAVLGGAASAAGFEKVPFKYTSNHHLRPTERFATTALAPAALAEALAVRVRSRGGQLVQVKAADEPTVPRVSADGDRCWWRTHAILQEEWRAFAANSFDDFSAIDRSSTCPEVAFVPPAPGTEVWLMVADLPVRKVERGTRFIQVRTQIVVRAWEEAGRTHVYVVAYPMVGEVVPSSTATISHTWWEAVWGGTAAEQARDTVMWVRRVERSHSRLQRYLRTGPDAMIPVAPGQRRTDLCCCALTAVADKRQSAMEFMSTLEQLGASLPPQAQAMGSVPTHVHMPRAACTERLGESCVSAMACVQDYAEVAAEVAEQLAAARGADEEVSALVGSSADAVVSVILLGEMVRARRISVASEAQHVRPPSKPFARAVTCDTGGGRPTATGLCRRGSFYGPVHVGMLGLVAHADRDVATVGQVALVSTVGHDFRGGAQVGALFSSVEGSFHGIAQAGLTNETWHTFRGIVQAGGSNIAGDFRGLAQVGLASSAGTLRWIQAGLYSDARTIQGIQVGGLFARGQHATGIQVGAATWHDRHDGLTVGVLGGGAHESTGLVIHGLLGFTGDLTGGSVAVVNVGGEVVGAQLGVVNVADSVAGTQLGLINIARGARFSVVPLVRVGTGN